MRIKKSLGKKLMRQMFERNMSVLSKRWPHIAQLIKNCKSDIEYEAVLSHVGGSPNLIAKLPDGRKIQFHSPNPKAEALSYLSQPDFRYPQFVVFLGLGLGFYPLFFLSEKSQTLKYMLIVEKDPEVLKWAMSLVDLTPVLSFPGTQLMVGVPEEKTYPFLRSYMEQGALKYYAKTIKMVIHEPSFALHKDYYMKVVRDLRDAVRETLLFFGNDPHDSLIGLDNIIKNLANIAKYPGIKDLFGKFRGKPAICVASGPSLKKNVHLLKDVQDKALIFCCDATLKPLLKHGVKPHFVTSLERVPEVVPFFEGLDAETLKNTWLAACPVVVPEVYDTYQGPKVIVYRDFAHFKWLGIDKGILRIGPSCANMSFKIAEALGCNPIILVGQDLAFAETGESHVDGHIYGTDNVKPKGAFYVEGNYQEKVLTTPVWYMFLKHFELDVAEFKGLCINATEGGAKITGTKVMKLKDAIDNFVTQSFDPVSIIRENLKEPSPEEVASALDKLSNRIAETREFVDFVLQKFNEALEEVMEYKKKVLAEILKRDVDKITDEERQITNQLANKLIKLKTEILGHQMFYLFLMHVVQPYVIKSEVEFAAILDKYRNIEFARVEFVAKHEVWFKVMIKLIELCRERLDWAEEVLKKGMPVKPSR